MGAQSGPEPHVRNINQNHIGTAQNEESKQKLRTQKRAGEKALGKGVATRQKGGEESERDGGTRGRGNAEISGQRDGLTQSGSRTETLHGCKALYKAERHGRAEQSGAERSGEGGRDRVRSS